MFCESKHPLYYRSHNRMVEKLMSRSEKLSAIDVGSKIGQKI